MDDSAKVQTSASGTLTLTRGIKAQIQNEEITYDLLEVAYTLGTTTPYAILERDGKLVAMKIAPLFKFIEEASLESLVPSPGGNFEELTAEENASTMELYARFNPTAQ